MRRLWLDTETIGLCGPCKLIQYAVDNGPVQFILLLKGWERDQVVLRQLRTLFDMLYDPNVLFLGYNVAFDLFHLYRVLHRAIGYKYHSKVRPIAPFKCQVQDLYIDAVKLSPLAPFAFSKNASKSVAAVRQIPTVAKLKVAEAVEKRLSGLIPGTVKLVRHEKKIKGHPELTTLVWTVDGRLSLKNLMRTYGLPTLDLADVWPLPAKGTERPWLPYPDPKVHGPLEDLCDDILRDRSLSFWKYAELDIIYLKILFEKLGSPDPDFRSENCHCTAYGRYVGYPLDRKKLRATRDAYAAKVEAAQAKLSGINLASAPQRLKLLQSFDPLIAASNKKVVKVIADDPDNPAAEAAQAMLDFSAYKQRLIQVKKLLQCVTRRAHLSIRVIGTRTWRGAGESGFNAQGICQADGDIGIRAALHTAAVGDWKQFEVAISAAAFPDDKIQEDLDLGIDSHSMNFTLMHPTAKREGITYEYMKEQVDAGNKRFTKFRKGMKPVTFGLAYFCQAQKVAETLGISLEEGETSLEGYYSRYQGFAAYKKTTENETCTCDTEHWDKWSARRMARTVTDMTGETIRWNFEADVCAALWELGSDGINTGIIGQVIRKSEKGWQDIDQAIRSALLGSAVAIQQAVMRQRGNAKVQATGANINNRLQARIWKELRLPCLSIHDELIFAPVSWFGFEDVQQLVTDFTTPWKQQIKSLEFDFKPTQVWADKP